MSEKPSVDEIFCTSIEIESADQRQSYLNRVCSKDAALQQQVDRLLQAHYRGGSIVDAPVAIATSGQTDLLPRQQLGDFRLIRELGRGGMGTVYEAEQLSIGRRVALKVLPFAALVQESSLQRFRNEARAAAALDHPHIVSIYTVGEERGVHHYAMQLIRGQTLADLIDELRGTKSRRSATPAQSAGEETGDDHAATIDLAATSTPSTPRDVQARISTALDSHHATQFYRSAARLGIQAAEALQYAHDHGVLHRDIKPCNLMLDAEAQLYITDFGLARIEADVGITVTGNIVGTLRYMAPEQALAKRVVIDHRADIYSLGATLYELLTLQPAFGETDRSQLLKQIAFEEPTPLRKLDRRIPVDLETIVLNAMAKNPDERYQTAQQLADDLRAFLENRPIQARPPTLIDRAAKWSRRHVAVVWSFVTILVLVTIGSAFATLQQSKLLEQAIVEQQRAERNFETALKALDSMCDLAIGEDRFSPILIAGWSSSPLTDEDEKFLRAACEFYESFVEQNLNSRLASPHVGKACIRLAQIHEALRDNQAPGWYQRVFDLHLEAPTRDAEKAAYYELLGDAYFGMAGSPASKNQFDDPAARQTALRSDAREAYTTAIEADPGDAMLYYKRSQAHFFLMDTEKQDKDLLRSIELAPRDPRFRVAYARTNINGGRDIEGSMQQLKVALKINPADSRASTLMVQVLRSQGKFDEAKTEVERALNCEGKKTPRLYGEWCALALDMGDHTEALKIAEKTVELFPHHAEGYLWKGDLLYRDGRFEEAIAEYTRCMSSQGMRGTPQVSRGRAYLALGQLDKALDDINQALQAVQGMYGDGWIFKSRGEIHFRMGNFDKALADMREAVRRKDFSALSWIPFAEIASCPDAAFRAGMFQLSNEAIRLGEAEGYVFRGMVQAESNDVAKAILEFRKAAESDPDNFYFSYLNALAQLAARDTVKYRSVCKTMLAQAAKKRDADVVHYPVWTCVLAPGAVENPAAVVELAKAAFGDDNQTAQYITALGAALYRAGKCEEAAERLGKLASRWEEGNRELDATSPVYAMCFLAMAHYRLGHAEEALKWLEKANVQSADEAIAGWNRRFTLQMLRHEAGRLLQREKE